MEKQFRTEPIQVEGETINLEFRPISEIFKDDDAPYLAVGMTKGGKTTTCIDIIHKYAAKAAKIYYVSSTKAMVGDSAIDTIPQLFRASPTFDNLYNIWKEIKEGAEQSAITPEYMMSLLAAIYPQSDVKKIINIYNSKMRQVDAELHSKHKNVSPQKINEVVANEKDLIAVEVLTRLILSGVNVYGMSKLDKKQENIIRTLLSSEQKTILLIDDVTSELNDLKSSNQKVMFGTDGQESQMPVSKAMHLLLTDMFTKARRYNVLMVIFVHTWNTIDVKNQLKNFIIIDPQTVDNLKMIKTVGTDKTKKLIREASKRIFGKYPYHVIVVKDDVVFTTKAEMNIGNTVKLDTLNQNLLNAYNGITTGLDYIPNDDKQVEVNQNVIDEIKGLID